MSITKRIKRIAKAKLYRLKKLKEVKMDESSFDFEEDKEDHAQFLKNHRNGWQEDPKTTEAFRILEIPSGSTLKEITRAYRAICKRYHPDRFLSDPEKQRYAHELLIKVNAAYQHLITK